YGITEPLLAPFQRFIPPMGQIDISPMVAIIALAILQYVLKFIVATVFNLPLE
ncbi:YggT family protein, partial [Anaerolineae bacterium CFX7]|nr:YggT family protein [Anaerolineae bacterium CFX7]